MSSQCVMCEQPLGGSYVRNEWGESYCSSHSSIEGCLWCGSHKKLRIEHGLHACVDCWDEVVLDDSVVADCAETVMRWLESVIGPHRLHTVPVVYGGLSLPPPSGGTLGWTLSRWTGKAGSAEISTVGFMPRTALLQLLAHEYGHVLLIFDPHSFRVHADMPTEDLKVEGFCEVVSSEFLRDLGTDRSLKLLERMQRNRNPVYGDGYRLMLPEMHSAGGIAPLCSQLTKWKPQPGFIAPAPTVSPAPAPAPGPMPSTAPPTSTSSRPAPIPMRPVVKRTDTPRKAAEHRPQIVMTNITSKPVTKTPPANNPERPVIPMKPK